MFIRFIQLYLLALALCFLAIGCASTAVNPKVDFELRKVAFQIGDTQIHAYITKFGDGPLTMVNLHEDERTSVQAGETVLKTYGGQLIRLVHSGQRRVVFSLEGQEYSFDPNRIFSKAGVRKTLRSSGSIPESAYATVDKFAEQFVRYFALGRNGIITLHNNGDGGLSIHTYEPGGEWAADTDELHVSSKVDPDDFYFVTDKRFFGELRGKDSNVVLQNNDILRDDGSLSVFSGRHKIPYINVEAQPDHLDQQVEMLETAAKLMRSSRR